MSPRVAVTGWTIADDDINNARLILGDAMDRVTSMLHTFGHVRIDARIYSGGVVVAITLPPHNETGAYRGATK